MKGTFLAIWRHWLRKLDRMPGWARRLLILSLTFVPVPIFLVGVGLIIVGGTVGWGIACTAVAVGLWIFMGHLSSRWGLSGR